MKLAGNDMLIQSLINEGLSIFGYPGGAALLFMTQSSNKRNATYFS